jgi:hypothetical protein
MAASIIFGHMHRYERRLHHLKYCGKIKKHPHFSKELTELFSRPFTSHLGCAREGFSFFAAGSFEKR